MTRCDNEGAFYRVFCVGLLIIAVAFTVILTNVFIDIDGLLSKKERESSNNHEPRHVTDLYDRIERTTESPDYYLGDKDDSGSAYRTKRSLDPPDFLLHIKNPKMKSILTHRLATLLEELDDEESTQKHSKTDNSQDSNDIYVRTESKAKLKEVEEVTEHGKTDDEKLHMAMHNILLKGVIEHMDLSDVYKKVHALVRSYKNKERIVKEKAKLAMEKKKEVITEAIQTKTPLNEENRFFDELMNCKKLQQDIIEVSTEKTSIEVKPAEVVKDKKPNNISPKFLIKTLIDIQKNEKDIDKNSKENIKGIIRLIYNGKSIKIRGMDEEETTPTVKATTVEATSTTTSANNEAEVISDILKQNFAGRDISKSYVNSVLIEYLSKYKKRSEISEQPIKYTERRLKRNIKVHHIKDTKRFRKPTTKKNDDDELYVEIETHFDDKGMKGKKKKELIKQLIEKIQKAIHSNQEIVNQKKPAASNRRDQEMHVRKRIQSSLVQKNNTHPMLLNKNNKNMLAYDANMYREQAPISKSQPLSNPLPRVADENGQDWRRREIGPKFFSTSKSINSAELSQVDVDFNKVMSMSGIPQRLQLPLNTGTDPNASEENPNAYLDLGNMQFMIKDIEGSGFSIGLNQFVDHAPDPESIKLFTGIESLVNAYHQTYDQNNPDYSKPAGISVLKHEMKKRDIEIKSLESSKENGGKHVVNKRSLDQGIRGSDYHSNEYKIIFDDKFLPYDNYQEIYEHKRKKVSLPVLNRRKEAKSEVKENKSDVASDLDNIFEQKLKPSEIFDLASFLDRKKRSHGVQKIMNLNTKIRMNRYINTKAMPKQKFFLKNKRNKRQIGKIRIIAKDMKSQSGSDENIFIVSDENMYADRALVRRTDIADSQEDKAEEAAEYEPSIFEDTKPTVFALEDKVRHNTLMSKYPHVFIDDEGDDIVTPIPATLGRMLVDSRKRKPEAEIFNDHELTEDRMPKVQDLVHALVPYPKPNYKVTVKLLPKDENDTRSGFKEVHTSINKTLTKNGMLYSSMLNVSEISKIESSNDTNDNHPSYINALQTIGFPYHDIKTLERKDNTNNEFNLRVATTPPLENKHDELTRILQAQKESIDKHFSKLKDKINKMTRTKTTQAPIDHKELMEILAPSNPPETVQVNKNYINEFLCKHLKEEALRAATSTTTTTTPTTTTTVTTQTTPKPEVIDALKIKLLSAISQNERLTSRILNKIDQNTDILQTFLTKITDKIQSIPELTKAISNKMKEDRLDHVDHAISAHPIYVRQPDNNTDVPFIYAYKPCRPATKIEAPVASIIYQVPKPIHKVEIHSNHPNELIKNEFDFDTLIQKDNTRYFIDEDYFKTVPNRDAKGDGLKNDEKKTIHDHLGNPGIPIVPEHNTMNHPNMPAEHNPMNHQVMVPQEQKMIQPIKNNNVNINSFRYKSNAPAPKQNFNMTKVM